MVNALLNDRLTEAMARVSEEETHEARNREALLELSQSEGGGYPDNNPKTQYGVLKPSLSYVPSPALLVLAAVMKHGADKYGKMNWRKNKVAASIYYDAALRHLLQFFDGDDNDPESGLLHLGHVMACCAILIDASYTGNMVDDREAASVVDPLIRQLVSP